MVTKPIDGEPATTLNGGTIAFLMSDAKQAEAWHNAGVANGGTSIEDPPESGDPEQETDIPGFPLSRERRV
ncbi:MAG TPA: hypothetical protein VGN30_19490 [Steroidobacteraceae bacterium]